MCLPSRVKLLAIVSLLIICVLSFALFSYLKFTARPSDPGANLATPAKTAAVALPAKCGGWSIVPNAHPHPGTTEQFLGGAAVSANDAWAVGNYVSDIGSTLGLIEHWNGSAWSVVSHPNLGPDNASEHFNALAALSANDVWAVGEYTYRGAIQRTLAEHWDGTRWSVVTSPNAGSSWNELNAITVISTGDAWAVGNFSSNNDPLHTLTEHWDGTRWSIVTSPNAGSDVNNLLSVTTVSADDVWAAGRYFSLAHSQTQPLIEHWNGSVWSVVTSPSPGFTGFATYEGIAALSTRDIWAVGAYSTTKNALISKTLIEHWDGTSWKIVPGPTIQQHSDSLISITAISPDNVWVVGATETQGSQKVLIGHWNGTKWNIVPGANSADTSSILRAVTHVPGSSYVWAMGMLGNSTFTEFYC